MKISFVIPAYNTECYIETTLKSLLNQKVKQFEIIVIDDGSTDNTFDVAKRVLLTTDSIKYKIVQKRDNEGVAIARNIGLIETEGDYVVFLDSDDYVSTNLVGILVRYSKRYPVDIICWKYKFVYENEKVGSYDGEAKNKNIEIVNGLRALKRIMKSKDLYGWLGSMAFKKDFLKKNNLKYTEGCINGEDKEFIFKSLSLSENVMFIEDTLSYYVQREGSITHSYNIRRFDAILALKRVQEFIEKYVNDSEKFKYGISLDIERLIIESYIYIFNSLIERLTEQGFSFAEAFGKLNDEIEKVYPSLQRDIFTLMRSTGNLKNIKFSLKTRLFLKAPRFYYLLKKTCNHGGVKT